MENHSFVKKMIGGLEFMETPGNDEDPIIILLHGYGANANDLTFFPDYCHFKDVKPTWIFPRGIEPVQGFSEGRAWFPLSISQLLTDEYQHSDKKLSELFPEELFIKPTEAIKNLVEDLNLPHERTFLGGFSQGAMISTDVILSSHHQFPGLFVLSGTLVKETKWRQYAMTKKKLSIIQTHGTRDDILPWKAAKKLSEVLQGPGITSEFISFDGGHEIPGILFNKFVSVIESGN
ncbi:MAG: hypothetical protein RSB82_03190 [Victivallaceae bacterium]